MKTEEGIEIWFFLLLFHASVPEQELNLKPRTKSSAAATAVAITWQRLRSTLHMIMDCEKKSLL
jgi:hypothetical protein